MLNQRGLNNSNWQINSIKEEMANNKICNNKNLKNHKKKGKKKYTKMNINRWQAKQTKQKIKCKKCRNS